MNSLLEIILEDLDDEYGKGKYGEFNVIVMKNNGFINATKICNDVGRKFSDWFATKYYTKTHCIEIAKNVSSTVKNKTNDLFISIKNEKNQIISGTYVHPLIIPFILSWIGFNNSLYIEEMRFEKKYL